MRTVAPSGRSSREDDEHRRDAPLPQAEADREPVGATRRGRRRRPLSRPRPPVDAYAPARRCSHAHGAARPCARRGRASRVSIARCGATSSRTRATRRGSGGRGADDVAAEVARLQAVQLDSIATVDRAHRLTLASRIGAYAEAGVSRLLARRADLRVLGARGLPARDRGLPALQAADGATCATATGGAASGRPSGARSRSACSARIREEGALPSAGVRGAKRRRCGAGSRRSARSSTCSPRASSRSPAAQGFQRLYDLPERVIPRAAPRRAGRRRRRSSAAATRCARSRVAAR